MKSVHRAAVEVLMEARRVLPADMIAETLLDRGWCTSQAESRKEQIRSLGSTLQSWVTRTQPTKPPRDHIFFRERGQHPKTGRKVYLYGLLEWHGKGTAPSNNGSVSQDVPVSRVTIPLDGENREKIELLVRSGKYDSASEAVLAAVGWGLEVITKELEEIKEALDKIKRIPL